MMIFLGGLLVRAVKWVKLFFLEIKRLGTLALLVTFKHLSVIMKVFIVALTLKNKIRALDKR